MLCIGIQALLWLILLARMREKKREGSEQKARSGRKMEWWQAVSWDFGWEVRFWDRPQRCA